MTKKILLAEDGASVRDTLGRALESEHYIVAFATTVRDAAEEFVADFPDLVLLDLDMLNQGDWDMFGMMRQMHPLVPVIAITAKSQQYKRASVSGIDALREKPLNLPLLLATIADLVAESGMERIRQATGGSFKTLYLENRP